MEQQKGIICISFFAFFQKLSPSWHCTSMRFKPCHINGFFLQFLLRKFLQFMWPASLQLRGQKERVLQFLLRSPDQHWKELNPPPPPSFPVNLFCMQSLFQIIQWVLHLIIAMTGLNRNLNFLLRVWDNGL